MRWRSLRSSLLSALPFGIGGNGFLDRIRAVSFAMLGLTAAAALALVLFAASQGWPQVGSLLPIPAAHRQAVSENSIVAEPPLRHGTAREAPLALIGNGIQAPVGGSSGGSPAPSDGGRHHARVGDAPASNVVVSSPAPGASGGGISPPPAPAPPPPPSSAPTVEAPAGSVATAPAPSEPTTAPTTPPVSTPTTDPTPTTPDEGSLEEGNNGGSEPGSESEPGHGHWGHGAVPIEPGTGGPGSPGHGWHQPAPTPPTATPPPTTVPIPTEPESGPSSAEDWSGRGHGHSFGRSR